jgi:hypothetical protein
VVSALIPVPYRLRTLSYIFPWNILSLRLTSSDDVSCYGNSARLHNLKVGYDHRPWKWCHHTPIRKDLSITIFGVNNGKTQLVNLDRLGHTSLDLTVLGWTENFVLIPIWQKITFTIRCIVIFERCICKPQCYRNGEDKPEIYQQRDDEWVVKIEIKEMNNPWVDLLHDVA